MTDDAVARVHPPRRGARVVALAAAFVALAAALVAPAAARVAASPAPRTLAAPAPARAVAAVGMTVADVPRSTAFFTDVLAFEKVDDVEVAGPAYDRLWGLPGVRARVVRLRLGGEELELTEFITPKGRPYPADSRSNDRWFQHVAIVVADMDAAYARVRARVAAISLGGPQTLPASNVAAAGISAFYFRDPDGHALELIHFPRGKGAARWQDTGGRLFLGIDHTALGVGATGASLAFYRDTLGMAVAGESLNVGAEQERLTGVGGARVRITGLHAPAGLPGIELLDYRAPADGRDAPGDTRANDVVHWYATIVVADVAAAARRLRSAGYAPAAAVTLPSAALGFTRAVVVHDPDGHALRLVEDRARGQVRYRRMVAAPPCDETIERVRSERRNSEVARSAADHPARPHDDDRASRGFQRGTVRRFAAARTLASRDGVGSRRRRGRARPARR